MKILIQGKLDGCISIRQDRGKARTATRKKRGHYIAMRDQQMNIQY